MTADFVGDEIRKIFKEKDEKVAVYVVSSKEGDERKEFEKYIEEVENLDENERAFTITVDRFTEGTTCGRWTSIVNATGGKAIESYVQFMYRGMETGGTSILNKKKFLFVDTNASRHLEVGIKKVQIDYKTAKGFMPRESDAEYRQMLNDEFDGVVYEEIDKQDVSVFTIDANKLFEIVNKKAKNSGLISANLDTYLLNILHGIIDARGGSKSSKIGVSVLECAVGNYGYSASPSSKKEKVETASGAKKDEEVAHIKKERDYIMCQVSTFVISMANAALNFGMRVETYDDLKSVWDKKKEGMSNFSKIDKQMWDFLFTRADENPADMVMDVFDCIVKKIETINK